VKPSDKLICTLRPYQAVLCGAHCCLAEKALTVINECCCLWESTTGVGNYLGIGKEY